MCFSWLGAAVWRPCCRGKITLIRWRSTRIARAILCFHDCICLRPRTSRLFSQPTLGASVRPWSHKEVCHWIQWLQESPFGFLLTYTICQVFFSVWLSPNLIAVGWTLSIAWRDDWMQAIANTECVLRERETKGYTGKEKISSLRFQ